MKIFEKQIWHVLLLLVLLFGVKLLAGDDAIPGDFLGVSSGQWLCLAIGVPIAHQLYVWLFWRLELYHKFLTNTLGPNAFSYYAFGFAILFASRPLPIIGLAIANHHTFPIPPGIAYTLAFLFTIFSFYLFYSVKNYFGFRRAFGIDHFDPSCKNEPFVKEGIFKWSKNAMYKFGFLVLWIPGLIGFSKGALIAALFSHLYIWVHYYCTEQPDMKRIYGKEE